MAEDKAQEGAPEETVADVAGRVPGPAGDGAGGEGTRPSRNPLSGPHGRRNRALAALACAALAAGLAAWGASRQASTLPADVPVEAGQAAAAALTAGEQARAALSSLEFRGADVSPDPSACEVTSEGGRVMVAESSQAPAAEMVSSCARRAAAMAAAARSFEGDAVEEVTWVSSDADGRVVVAVAVAPGDPAADLAAGGEEDGVGGEPTDSDLLHGSTGWDMTDEAHDGLPEGSGVDKSGGQAPTTPAGDLVVPGEPLPDQPAADAAPEGPSSGDGSSGGQPSGAASSGSESSSPAGTTGSSSGSQGGAASSSGSSTSASSSGASTSSSSSGGSSSQPAHSHSWVAVTHEEPTYGTEPVYGQRWVQDSAAWDETVRTGSYYLFSDGYKTYDAADAWAHQCETDLAYSVRDEYQTVHHEATGHYETVQTGTKTVQTGTRTVTDGYRCSTCGATK